MMSLNNSRRPWTIVTNSCSDYTKALGIKLLNDLDYFSLLNMCPRVLNEDTWMDWPSFCLFLFWLAASTNRQHWWQINLWTLYFTLTRFQFRLEQHDGDVVENGALQSFGSEPPDSLRCQDTPSLVLNVTFRLLKSVCCPQPQQGL